MSKLRSLITELRILAPIMPIGLRGSGQVFDRMLSVYHSLDNDPVVDKMLPLEFDSYKDFEGMIGLMKTMTPDAAAKHMTALWQGPLKQGLMRTRIGGEMDSLAKQVIGAKL